MNQGPILQHDTSDQTGSPETEINRFLKELVELAGQGDYAHMPVLELQFGDVLTRTSLSLSGDVPCLSIVALLPQDDRLNYLSRLTRPLVSSNASSHETELLWHADEGRYVVTCSIPTVELPDDRSVLDAILDTSDQARAWFAAVCACAPKSE